MKNDDEKKRKETVNAEDYTLLHKKIDDLLPFASPPDDVEKEIITAVLETLYNNEVALSYTNSAPRVINLAAEDDNRYLPLVIAVADHQIIMKADFPFRVQRNALAIVGLYANEFNSNTTCSNSYRVPYLALDLYKGEISMKLSWLVKTREEFKSETFLRALYILLDSAYGEYTVLANMSVCAVPAHLKHKYMTLMHDTKMNVPVNYRIIEKYGFSPDGLIYQGKGSLMDKLRKYILDNPVYIRENELKTEGFIDLDDGAEEENDGNSNVDMTAFYSDTGNIEDGDENRH